MVAAPVDLTRHLRAVHLRARFFLLGLSERKGFSKKTLTLRRKITLDSENQLVRI